MPVAGRLVTSRFAVGSTWSRSIGLLNSTATDEFGCTLLAPEPVLGSIRTNSSRQSRSLSTDELVVNSFSS